MQCPPVLAICGSPHNADAHWRVVRPLTRLREAGVDAAWCWLDDDEMPTLPVDGHVVVLQRIAVKGGTRQAVNAWIDRLRAAGALAVVYEADDDIWSPAYLAYLDACGRISESARRQVIAEAQAQVWAMQACDAVTVTTEPLAAVARQYTDAPVFVVPNAIDVEWFRDRLLPRPEWHSVLTIGWAGGRRPEADLEPMAVAWGRIAARYPSVRFVVAGWQHDVIYREIEDLDRIIRVPWRELDDYPPGYQTDIGCAIAPDNAFSRCKSPIKAWEYALAGAAVVASPVPYSGCVGWGGAIARTDDDWERALAYLIEHQDERQRAATDLRAHVTRRHSLVDTLAIWTDAYTRIGNGQREEVRDGRAHQLVAR